MIFEVLSSATRRVDEGENKEAYLTIPSLFVSALIKQETAAVVLYRRTEQGFIREIHEGLGAVLPLNEIEIELPLQEIYDGAEFLPETDESVDG